MNCGIQNASGNVIQVLHSDDYNIDENIYEKVRTIFKKVNCEWLFARVRSVDIEKKFVGETPPKFIKMYKFRLLKIINYIPHVGVFMRKNIFETYGYFDIGLKILMDWEYWLRIGKKYTPFFVDEYWCTARLHQNSLSIRESFSKLMHQEEWFILKRHLKWPYNICVYAAQFMFALIHFLKRKTITIVWKFPILEFARLMGINSQI